MQRGPSSAAERPVVLDLDGTVAVGDDPVSDCLAAIARPGGAGASSEDLAALLDARPAGRDGGHREAHLLEPWSAIGRWWSA